MVNKGAKKEKRKELTPLNREDNRIMVWATNDTNQANNLFNSLTTSSAVH